MSSAAFEHTCELNRKGWHWSRRGHPWVYRDDLKSLSGEHGDIVRVAYENQTLGSAFLGTRSKIALRWIERSAEPAQPDPEFWRRRFLKAIERRSGLPLKTSAWRVIHDAADGIPGLILDRYDQVAVLQTSIAGTERLLPVWTALAQELLGVQAVAARNDIAVRSKEGLPEAIQTLAGVCPERIWVWEEGPGGKVEYPVLPLKGQKTGAFLDQRDNRWRTAELARGRLLDAFSYIGLFALHAADRIQSGRIVDTSTTAMELSEQAIQRNQADHIQTEQRNIFDYLKEAAHRGENFDTIILDPPAFAKSRQDLQAALRAYRDLNRRAMEILNPGGILVTCSCSYNLSEAEFEEVLRDAASEARADFRVIERRGQSADHPILLCHPESRYLKCLILEKV